MTLAQSAGSQSQCRTFVHARLTRCMRTGKGGGEAVQRKIAEPVCTINTRNMRYVHRARGWHIVFAPSQTAKQPTALKHMY